MTDKQLIMSLIMTFLLSLMLMYFIHEIIVRIKNKTSKKLRRQITHKTIKIDLCEYLMANMKQEFIGQRKMILNQLVRM